MSLEDIMITEISLSQRDKFCMIPLLEISKTVKFTETGSRCVVIRGREKGRAGRGCERYKVAL